MIISLMYGAIGIRLKRLNLKKRRIPDISFIDENFGVGGASSIQSIAKNNIQNILDLRKEAQDDPEEIKKHSINYLHIEINDGDSPTFAQAMQAIKWLEQREKSGKTLIHCNLGRGRAPSIAVLYLVYKGSSAANAIRIVKKCRKFSYFNKAQLKMIYDFEKNKQSDKI